MVESRGFWRLGKVMASTSMYVLVKRLIALKEDLKWYNKEIFGNVSF